MNSLRMFLSTLLAVLLLHPAVASGEEFRKVTGDYTLTYPKDHGQHPEYATEWWYFTGHLGDKAKRTYGFQLTFFRVGLTPPDSRSLASNWATNSLYLAHFALTDDEGKRFFHTEDRSRGSFQEAGAASDSLDVHLKRWSARMDNDGTIRLEASTDEFGLQLSLTSKKPLVLQGKSGFSQKGADVGDASYYSSFTRLNGSGAISIHGERRELERASVWMDHEFSSSRLARDELGWDWFAVQLSTGEEIMVYQLRKQDGSISSYSSGTFVDREGKSSPLTDFQIEILSTWKSSTSGVAYPAKRKLRIPSLELELEISPTVDNQELQTEGSTGVTYWEGRATAQGVRSKSPVTAEVYIELVGYQPGKRQ